NPVATNSRTAFGQLNAGLQETITGIEVVKSSAQEAEELQRFMKTATNFRNYFVKQGEIEARYLPLLLLGLATTGGFVHSALLYRDGLLSIGDIIAYMGMFQLLTFPTFISIFTFSLVQMGYAGAERILELIKAQADLDENQGGYQDQMKGKIEFKKVSFDYNHEKPVLKNLSYTVQPGQTVAIVWQTGSGKSSLSKLINRIYDVHEGQILIDDVDVREWSLDGLRSQISVIEQDIFLFSRTIAENIAFGVPNT